STPTPPRPTASPPSIPAPGKTRKTPGTSTRPWANSSAATSTPSGAAPRWPPPRRTSGPTWTGSGRSWAPSTACHASCPPRAPRPPTEPQTAEAPPPAPSGHPTRSLPGGSAPGTEAAAAAPSGDRIGKYQVVRKLGGGGQAGAYLAFDPDLRRHVVLKLYHEA